PSRRGHTSVTRDWSADVCSSDLTPSMLILILLGLLTNRVWVAKTFSTWLVPIPNAIVPKAPCVEVWLSPHTMVMPGWVMPSSGRSEERRVGEESRLECETRHQMP